MLRHTFIPDDTPASSSSAPRRLSAQAKFKKIEASREAAKKRPEALTGYSVEEVCLWTCVDLCGLGSARICHTYVMWRHIHLPTRRVCMCVITC